MKTIHILFFMFILATACDLSVNENIYIADNKVIRNSMNSVNGNIIIGSNCRVRGGGRTVNGRIEVGANSEIMTLQTVNGSVKVERDVIVDGDINTVNGMVECLNGVTIFGDVSTVNGQIDLSKTLVRRDITTYNGDIRLADSSRVRGDIRIKSSKGNEQPRQLRIEISENSIVEGDVTIKDRDLDVKVYLLQGGRVNGKITNAEIIRE